jgi:type II secretion system protein J
MNSSSESRVRRPEFRTAKSPHDVSGRQHGFTLLEVLMAVAIMLMIVTVIYATFFTAGRNVKQAEASRDATDLARTLVTKLSTDIAGAYINPNMNVPVVTTIFYGQSVQPETETELDKNRYDALDLTTLTNWRTPDSQETDLWEVSYYFNQKPDGSGYVMMRREKRQLSNDTPALQGGIEYTMTDRVRSLQLRYYDGTSWLDQWDSRSLQTLPNAVEITLVLDNGSTYITQVEVGR